MMDNNAQNEVQKIKLNKIEIEKTRHKENHIKPYMRLQSVYIQFEGK